MRKHAQRHCRSPADGGMVCNLDWCDLETDMLQPQGRKPVHVCLLDWAGSLGSTVILSMFGSGWPNEWTTWRASQPQGAASKGDNEKVHLHIILSGTVLLRKPTQEALPSPAKSEEGKGGVCAPHPHQGKRSQAGETVQEVLRTQDLMSPGSERKGSPSGGSHP